VVAVAGAHAALRRKRVFILGPSHHVYIDHCALSEFEYYATPLGNLTVDTETLLEIGGCGEKFQWMHAETDEGEHSIEMHLPYIYKMLDLAGKVDSAKVVPILVGAITTQKEKLYGRALAKYLKDPENVFVISSDFCHW
jgi:AmmeMemoRadiSam system protein B